ncbi:hypothetical protein C0995_004702 [Termitomyces sp. Mi166|nr:hypothetical protein C0995_004702 [Termitomyces sp. Mi166\
MLALLIVMSVLLGATSFACGILPLSIAFSKAYLERLSAVGTGLLLGAALGVIIPEGIETAVEASPGFVPTSTIALSLIFGFTFMLVIEQIVSPHAHSHNDHDLALHAVKKDTTQKSVEVEFDAELGELEQEEGLDRPGYRQLPAPASTVPSNDTHVLDPTSRAFSLTFGLIIHGLADGLALGASSLAKDQSGISSSLSLIVFLALIIHKAPTSLALTTALLAISLPRPRCKKYLIVFASSTPISAVASYVLFSFFGNGDDNWTGIALLVSGGTFLYVATVLQPVSDHRGASPTGDMRPITRVFHIAVGMVIPFVLSMVLGHGH